MREYMREMRALAWVSLGAFLMASVGPAMAAVDFTDTVLQGLDIINVALLALAAFVSRAAMAWLKAKTGFENVQMERQLQAQLNEVLTHGISLAYQAAVKKAKSSRDDLTIEFDNVFVGMAVRYVKDQLPELIARYGWTDDKIKEIVVTRLTNWMNDRTKTTADTLTVAEAQSRMLVEARGA